MTEDIELTREELAALVLINDATNAGKAVSKSVEASKRLEQNGYVAMTSEGLVSASKGKKWIGDNTDKVEAYFKGEEWLKKQMSKGNWIKE